MASGENIAPFLNDIELRPLTLDNDRGLEPVGLALGNGQGVLEVAVMRATHRPQEVARWTAWRSRLGGRAGGEGPGTRIAALRAARAAANHRRGRDHAHLLDGG